MTIKIQKLKTEQLNEALQLVWDVFCKYEAVNYTESGKTAFWQAIHSIEYLNMLTAYGAFAGDKLIGIIATRNKGAQIALFFVDENYQHRGIGKKLFEASLKNNSNSCITVHSSEYAVNIYKKLGFVPETELIEDNGIRYIKMILRR